MKLRLFLVVVVLLVPLAWTSSASALPPTCSTSYCLENPNTLCSVSIHLVMLCCDYIGGCPDNLAADPLDLGPDASRSLDRTESPTFEGLEIPSLDPETQESPKDLQDAPSTL